MHPVIAMMEKMSCMTATVGDILNAEKQE